MNAHDTHHLEQSIRLRPRSRVASAVANELRMRGRWRVRCRDKIGRVKWEDTITNLVTNEGESYMLQAGLDAQTQITTWYVGLTDGTPTVAEGDTLPSHAGWAEVTDYTGNRPTWSGGTESGQSIDNSASPASFTMNGSATVGGAFLASSNTGTSGTLYAVGAFSGGDRSLVSSDVLEVTATFTAGGA